MEDSFEKMFYIFLCSLNMIPPKNFEGTKRVALCYLGFLVRNRCQSHYQSF